MRCWRSSPLLRTASTSILSWAASTSAFCLHPSASFRAPLTVSSWWPSLGCAVLGRGAEPPQNLGLLLWLEPGLSHVTWVHYDATMCLACLVCSVLPVLHFL